MNLSKISFRDRHANKTSITYCDDSKFHFMPVVTGLSESATTDAKIKTPSSSNSISFELLEEFRMMGTGAKDKVTAAAAFEQ